MVELYDNRSIFKNNVIGFKVSINCQWVAFRNGSRRKPQKSLVNGLTWSLSGNLAKHRDNISNEDDLKKEFNRQLIAIQNYCSRPEILANKGQDFVKFQKQNSKKWAIDIPWLEQI